MSQNKDMIKLLLLLNKSIVETFTLMNSVSRMHAHTHAHTLPPYCCQPLPLIAALEPDGVKICLIYIHVTWLKSTVGVRRVRPRSLSPALKGTPAS